MDFLKQWKGIHTFQIAAVRLTRRNSHLHVDSPVRLKRKDSDVAPQLSWVYSQEPDWVPEWAREDPRLAHPFSGMPDGTLAFHSEDTTPGVGPF